MPRGWTLPDFAHLPLIHGSDGKKLSKRHGATGLEEFEAKGYLPEAIRNYLARLSWSHGDDEIFSTEQVDQTRITYQLHPFVRKLGKSI